ncbi:MAG: MmgE/PrpD family protein [Alphaproteobacteria bacterium]
MGVTREVAEFVAELKYSDLSPHIIQRTKDHILDQLGIQIGVSRKPWLKLAVDYVMTQGNKPESSIACCREMVSAENAAFVNGTFGHGFEMDDVYAPALAHPGPAVVPAALAIAERDGCSGEDFLLAVVAGYEVMGRCGYALSPSQLYRGFHPTSAAGPLGSVTATGKLMGLDADTMVHALAVSASFCSGVTECYKSGGEVKRYHGGIGAQGGIRAAMLAKMGLTGPSTVLEGPLGMRAFSDTYTPEVITDGLGERFVVADIWTKKYSCNGMIHAPVDGIEAIRARRPFGAADIERIDVGSNQHAVNEVGSIRLPKDMFGFQFSMNYALALQVVKGSNDFDAYIEENLRDPQIVSLAEFIFTDTDEEVQSWFPETLGARVTIKFKDGSVEEELIRDCRGSPGNPMTAEELETKARNIASMSMTADKFQGIIDAVRGVDTMPNARKLGDLLRD